jgi:hypothetical protein
MAITTILLSTNGDGTGDTEVIGDYSVTPGIFEFIAPADTDRTAEVVRMIVSIRDTGMFDAETYGNGITLTNGLTMSIRNGDGSHLEDVFAFPIRSNADWASHVGPFGADVKTWGQGDEFLVLRWTFADYMGTGSAGPMVLQPGQRLRLTAADDLSGLVSHRFVLEGHRGQTIRKP